MHAFPTSIKFISSQRHSCGFSECQNITISAVTAKLGLAWPEFLGIKTEARATTNTLHRSPCPEPSRCLSNLDTLTTNALGLNIWLACLSLLRALCVYQEEWVIFLHDAHHCCKGGHLHRSNRAEKRMCVHIHAQWLFLELKLQDEPDKDKMYVVKRCNSKPSAQWRLCCYTNEVLSWRLHWCVISKPQLESKGLHVATAQLLYLERWLLLICRHNSNTETK